MFSSALLVEDELNLAQAIEIALNKMNIKVVHTSTLNGARKNLKAQSPSLIVLDLNLPDGDGMDYCVELRKSGFSGAILMLTARGQIEDRVSGLMKGADDYLSKPFSWEELQARIFALARRFTEPSKENQNDPLWEKDPSRLRVFGPLGWVELTPLEYKLVNYLMTSSPAIVSREDLLREVWGFSTAPKTRTVDNFLGRLRKAFETNPDEPTHFLTVRGAGYRFER